MAGLPQAPSEFGSGFDGNRNINPVTDALRHHAKFFKLVQASLQLGTILLIHYGENFNTDFSDPQSAALIARVFNLNLGPQAFYIGARFFGAEQQAGGEAIPHCSCQNPRRIGSFVFPIGCGSSVMSSAYCSLSNFTRTHNPVSAQFQLKTLLHGCLPLLLKPVPVIDCLPYFPWLKNIDASDSLSACVVQPRPFVILHSTSRDCAQQIFVDIRGGIVKRLLVLVIAGILGFYTLASAASTKKVGDRVVSALLF